MLYDRQSDKYNVNEEMSSLTCQWITTIMDRVIKGDFLEDWLMNWIKPIQKEEIKFWKPTIKLSWFAQLWPSYIAFSWNTRLAHGLNIIIDAPTVK